MGGGGNTTQDSEIKVKLDKYMDANLKRVSDIQKLK
jgi:hypothetical protein